MTETDGRALVAAYLKQLRIARGVDQEELATRLDVHKNTIQRAESPSLRETSHRFQHSFAIARTLGGDVSHIAALLAGNLPDEYPLTRMGLSGRKGTATTEVAVDVAKWHIELQDDDLAAQAGRRGSQIAGVRELTEAFRWAAFRDPNRALKVFL